MRIPELLRRGRLGYQAVILLQMTLSLVVAACVYKFYGVTADADAYFMATGVASAIGLVAISLIDQFLVHYSATIAAKKPPHELIFTALGIALLSGIAVGLAVCASSRMLISWFAPGFTANQASLANTLLLWGMGSTILLPLNQVLRTIQNVHGRYAQAALQGLLLPASAVLLILLWWLDRSEAPTLEAIVIATGVGAILQAAFGLFSLSAMASLKEVLRSRPSIPAARRLMWDSLKMRFAHNAHNFLTVAIINRLLSALPAGAVSSFFYARRAMDAVNTVALGPGVTIVQTTTAAAVSAGDRQAVRLAVRDYRLTTLPLFVLGAVAAYVCLPLLLDALNQTDGNGESVATQFAVLFAWYLVIAFEAPYVAMLIVKNMSMAFLAVNILFILIFFFLGSWLVQEIGVTGAGLAGLAAQVVSLALYRRMFLGVLRTIPVQSSAERAIP